MKKSTVLGMVLMCGMGWVNGQTELSDKEWEEANVFVVEMCKVMADYTMPADVKQEMKAKNISNECFCQQYAEAIIKMVKNEK